ncbi:MAG: MoaD/ThiS family protein [Pseudomonadales bacterium]|nr:MoaD/ThiS family protein [Pseudomonadales bacterium]
MALVEFTPNLYRHVKCQSMTVPGDTIKQVLYTVCEENTRLRSYLLDDQGQLRKHVTVFIDNVRIQDRSNLSDAVSASSAVYIAQALSGG